MKGTVVALGHIGRREVAALMVDGRLEDLLVEADGPRPGDVHRAVVGRPMKGQGGVLVRMAEGTGWLRGAKGLRDGQAITVQVTGYAEAGKAPPVTDRPLFKSRYAIATPGAKGVNVSRAIRDEDEADRLRLAALEAGAEALIVRSSAEGVPEDVLAEDVDAVMSAAEAVAAHSGTEPELLRRGDGPHDLAWRDWPQPDELERGANALEVTGALDAIDALRSGSVPLRPGSMAVEPTRALVAVDVNTGGDSSLAAGLKANIAALRELPRQLRLRGLGGLIVVDMAPLPKKDRRQIEQVVRAALRGDSIETTLAGWTPLGNLEFQRKRERVPTLPLLEAS